MESNLTHLQQSDGYVTRLFSYKAAGEAVLGTILILHGMAEHHRRYLHFIHRLNKEGFDVYAYDHRGHGPETKLSELGFFANRDGAALVVNDAIRVCKYIKENSRSEKFAILGHSMGSLVLRNLLQQYDCIDFALISGTSMPDASITDAGLFIGNLLCLFRGPKKQSKISDKLMFGNKLYTSLCTRTSFDWLTRNNTVVGQYVSDPYCGYICSTSLYRDVTLLVKNAANKKNIAKTRKDLPIHLIAGEKDPVGGYSKEVLKLHQLLQTLGFTETSCTIYPEARHELLNELNADEVMDDLAALFHKYLG